MILEFHRDHDPSVHTIFLNDAEVGRIVEGDSTEGDSTKGDGCKIVERCQYDRTAPVWDIGRHQFPTLKEAKRHLVRKIRDVYPGLERA